MIDSYFDIQMDDALTDPLPTTAKLQQWSSIVYEQIPLLRSAFTIPAETLPLHITLRLVASEEIIELNSHYRHKAKETNVLSFPFELPEGIPIELIQEVTLGDIILCPSVINREAQEQQKSSDAHWAHMVIHGHLHLLGYDHIDPTEAEIMEQHEIDLLKQLGFSNPYHPLQPPSHDCSKNIGTR